MWSVRVIWAAVVVMTLALVAGFVRGAEPGATGGGGGGGAVKGVSVASGAGTFSIEDVYQQGLHKEEGTGDLAGAVEDYKAVVAAYRQLSAQADKARPTAAKALLHLGLALEKLGRKGEAIGEYIAITSEFAGTAEANDARQRLIQLGVQVAGEDSDKAVRAKLSKVLADFNIKVPPVSAFLNRIGADAGVKIVCSSNVMVRDANANANAAFSLAVGGLTLEDALNLACKSFGYGWTVWSGAVYVDLLDSVEELKKDTQAKAIADKQLALLNEKVEIAKRALDNAQERYKAGALDMNSLEQAKVSLINAQNEVLQAQLTSTLGAGRPQAGGQTGDITTQDIAQFASALGAGRVRVLGHTLTTEDIAQLQSALESVAAGRSVVEVPAAPAAAGMTARQMQTKGYTVVTLYRRGLVNFTGAQAVSLHTGKTAYMPDATSTAEFFEKNPEFDIVCDDKINIDTLQEPRGLYLCFNKGRRIALLSEYATPETLPDSIQYEEPVDPTRTKSNSPPVVVDVAGYTLMPEHSGMTNRFIVSRTGPEEYFVRYWVDSQSNQKIYLAFAKLPFREKAREEMIERTMAEREALMEKRRTERSVRTNPERNKGGSVDAGAAASGTSIKVTLYDADVDNAPGGQVLNLETAESIARGADGDMHAFFEARPGFDLFFDRQLILVGDGIKAALLPEGTTAATIPSQITFEYKSASSPSDIQAPGVYNAGRKGESFLVIEPGANPVYIETKKGKYLLTGVSKAKDQITFTREKIK